LPWTAKTEIEEEQRLFYVALTRAKKKCFLTMHHEGVRGGITQFNKMSRFVDVPNVLSKLEFKDVAWQGIRELTEKEMQEVPPLYDKKHLLEKLMNFYKREN
jgi:superfamily I DNA/RNA helicase